MDANEMASDAAVREVFEETGLHVALLLQEEITISAPGAKSIPRPYACFLQDIPAHGTTAAHQHIERPQSGSERLFVTGR